MKKFSTIILIILFSSLANAKECVRLYYDHGPEGYWIGRTYALFAQNLLGHFPELQQIIAPIETYQKGDIATCRATIYIGSYFNNPIPPDFMVDFENTKQNVAWLGYNIWKLPIDRIFGFKYNQLTKLNTTTLDYELKPTFYKWINYKGERFYKYGGWSKTNPTEFMAGFEIAALEPINSVVPFEKIGTEILSTATHNGTNDMLPYVLRNKNHFYFADVPFSFMHEADRYLIFSDLLFDILNLPPRHKNKKALLRIEDVHPLVPLNLLYLFTNILAENKVPIHISIIPFFFDPFKLYDRKDNEEFVGASHVPEFVAWINEVKRLNGRFIWHGVTHQYGRTKNPHDGISGADFEFWDAVNNSAVAKDSVPWVLNRLYDGFNELTKIGVQPKIWLTPHYQASTLDYYLFGRVFPWNIGRSIYYNFEYKNKPMDNNPAYWFTDLNTDTHKKRIAELSQIQIKPTASKWNGQAFPYEIYGDIHGQRLLPENLGNSQPFENAHVLIPRTVIEIVADAKRNLVIRDAWASFFYHPFLFNDYNSGGRGSYFGDPAELVYLVTEIKKLGYEFIDAEDFAEKYKDLIRPEPIYTNLKKEGNL